MPDNLCEGAVYRVDMEDGKPPHYWIVLCRPRQDGTFLTISITDRHHARWNTDVWEYQERITEFLELTKPSVLQVAFTKIVTKNWLVRYSAEFMGVAPYEVIQRAKCNLFWFSKFLRPELRQYRDFYGKNWSDPCYPDESSVESG